MKRWIKWSLVSAFPIATFAVVGFTNMQHQIGLGKAYYDGQPVAQSSPATQQQIQQVQKRIQLIVTPNGTFERVNPAFVHYSQGEIAYSKANITSQTKELVLPYGTFVRVTDDQLKKQQLSDKQWALHHTQQWIDSHPSVDVQ